jgi:hypothetical protein
MPPSPLKSYAIVGLAALHNLGNKLTPLNCAILKSYAVCGIIMGNCGILKDKDYPVLSTSVELGSRLAGVGFILLEQNENSLLDTILKASIPLSFGCYTMPFIHNPEFKIVLKGATFLGTALPLCQYALNKTTASMSETPNHPEIKTDNPYEHAATLVDVTVPTGNHDAL